MKTDKLFLILILLAIISNSNLLKAQTLDKNGSPGKPIISANSLNAIPYNFNKSEMSWDTIRALTEINTEFADAYPYISPDGLRLYFSQGQTSDLYYVSRNSIYELFSNKELLSYNFPYGSFSCWLTNDELEIFYTSFLGGSIDYSTRSSISDPFSDPVSINLIGIIEDFISGPSLTPDKQELYLFNSTGNSTYILKFIESGSLTYTLLDTLDIPSGLNPGPGQLSKDGLKFFVNLCNDSDTAKLYQFSRNDLNSTFDNPTVLDNNINNPDYFRQIQPSISADENILVWVRNNNGEWDGNDLYIAYGLSTSISKNIQAIDLNINPNPAKCRINIDGEFLENATLSIHSIIGELMLQKELSSSQNEIDIHSLSKGIYIITIIGANRSAQRKLIKD